VSTEVSDDNTLQHTATHCNTLQHTATHCNVSTKASVASSLSAHSNTATHGNTLQHAATHTATHCTKASLASTSSSIVKTPIVKEPRLYGVYDVGSVLIKTAL